VISEPGYLARPVSAVKIERLMSMLDPEERLSSQKLPKKFQDILSNKLNMSVKVTELRIMLDGLLFLGLEGGYENQIRAACTGIAGLAAILLDGSPKALKNAQRHLNQIRGTLQSTTTELQRIFDEHSEPTRSQRKEAAVTNASLKEEQKYRNSSECRALKLLSLLQSRDSSSTGVQATELSLAKKLWAEGAAGVERLLRELAPPLFLEEHDIQRIRETFDEASRTRTPDRTIDYADAVMPPASSVEGSSLAHQVDSAESPDLCKEVLIPEAPAQDDQDTLEMKELLLGELGVTDSQVLQDLVHSMSVEGVYNAMRTFEGLGRDVTHRILESNPTLLSPTSPVNLPSFLAELKDFLDGSYDLRGYEIFDPKVTPQNFTDPSVLKRTKRAAGILRKALQSAERNK
jgi:hypothetical protein